CRKLESRCGAELWLETGDKLFWQAGDDDEIIFEEIEVVNEGPGQFRRRTHPVRQAESAGVLLSGRTAPRASALLIAKRLLVRQLVKLLFCFPLLPSGLVFADHKEIRGMKGGRLAPGGCLIAELEGGRLIVEFQDLLVVLRQVDRAQFDRMALKLDGHAHLA